jgi:hypothetical protein
LEFHDVDASLLHRQTSVEIVSTVDESKNSIRLKKIISSFFKKNLPLSASVDYEFALIIRQSFIVHHTLEGISLEIAEILVDESIVFNVGVLPLSMSP